MFGEYVFRASMAATAFANTALRPNSVEVSYSELLEEEDTEMVEAKVREIAMWIQAESVAKVREGQEVPNARLVSMC